MGAEQKRNPSTPEIILPKECQSLAPDCQEELRSYLTYLKEIEDSWFKIRTPKELNEATPSIQIASQRLWEMKRSWRETWTPIEMVWKMTGEWREKKAGGKAWETEREKMLWKVFDKAWRMAKDATRMTVWWAEEGAGWETDEYEDWRDFREKARDAYRTASILSANVAAGGAVWEIIKDQFGFKENPLFPKLELYGLGAFRFDIREVNEEEKLLVDFLLMKEDKKFLGCLAFGDGESEEVVPYFHRIGESCSQRVKTLMVETLRPLFTT